MSDRSHVIIHSSERGVLRLIIEADLILAPKKISLLISRIHRDFLAGDLAFFQRWCNSTTLSLEYEGRDGKGDSF